MRKVLPARVGPRVTSKLKRLCLIVIINLAILVPVIYAFEFFLERNDPRKSLPVNGMVNGKLFTWGHLVENNRFAFREREFEVPKPPGVFRIMVLGDSLTWGAGLAVEERFSNRLEKNLNEAYPGRKFEVLNFGFAAAPTVAERDTLKKFRDVTQPDLVIVGFCINDPQPKGQNYSTEREKFEARTKRMMTSLRYRLGQIGLPAIAGLIEKAAFGFAEKANLIPTWEEGLDRTYVKSSPEWQEFVKALGDIKQMSDEMKLPPPIFASLNQGQYTGSDYLKPDQTINYFLKWTRQAEQAANEVGFTTVNYEKEIPTELANDSLVINVVDGHPSAKLNQLYAKKLFSAVVCDANLNGRTAAGPAAEAPLTSPKDK